MGGRISLMLVPLLWVLNGWGSNCLSFLYNTNVGGLDSQIQNSLLLNHTSSLKGLSHFQLLVGGFNALKLEQMEFYDSYLNQSGRRRSMTPVELDKVFEHNNENTKLLPEKDQQQFYVNNLVRWLIHLDRQIKNAALTSVKPDSSAEFKSFMREAYQLLKLRNVNMLESSDVHIGSVYSPWTHVEVEALHSVFEYYVAAKQEWLGEMDSFVAGVFEISKVTEIKRALENTFRRQGTKYCCVSGRCTFCPVNNGYRDAIRHAQADLKPQN